MPYVAVGTATSLMTMRPPFFSPLRLKPNSGLRLCACLPRGWLLLWPPHGVLSVPVSVLVRVYGSHPDNTLPGTNLLQSE
jgi:hypothetical protein